VSSEKLTRKEIREPDKFLKFSTEFWGKAAQKQKAIGIGVAVVIGLFLVAALVSRSQHKQANASGGALAEALDLASRGVEGSFEASGDPDEPRFSTQQQKYEELSAALDKVRTGHSGTLAARSATYYFADAQYQLGKYEEADKAYGDFIGQASAGDPLRVLALEGRGYVAESKQDWAKSLELFEQMSREATGEPVKARAAYHRARILAASGKKLEAAEAYQKLKDDFKEAPAARQAGERLALLAAEGVKAPAVQAQAADDKK
jgi:tetratricopeptide (TPR) repeat protein